MGAFIVFEGGDGAGKTTQARILSRRLIREGYSVVLTREPGGTSLGETVRRWLKSQPHATPLTELFLFVAARGQLVREVISPALSSGRVVICDRFAASTVAYQGYGRGLDLELINRVNDVVTDGVRPDLTVFLDIQVEEALARKKDRPRDRFDSEATEFHSRAREGYLELASREPNRWLVIDGTLKRKPMADRIREGVQSVLMHLRVDCANSVSAAASEPSERTPRATKGSTDKPH